MEIGGIKVRFVRQYDDGSYSKADETSIDILARALVKHVKTEVTEEEVRNAIVRLADDIDSNEKIDYMGFEKSEAIRKISLGDRIIPYVDYVVILPNKREYTINIRKYAVNTEDMTKDEFEKYAKIKQILLSMRDNEIQEAEKRREEILKRREIEYKLKEFDKVSAKLSKLQEKYENIVEFIKEKGLQEELLRFIKIKKAREVEDEIRDEYNEIFDDEDDY